MLQQAQTSINFFFRKQMRKECDGYYNEENVIKRSIFSIFYIISKKEKTSLQGVERQGRQTRIPEQNI